MAQGLLLDLDAATMTVWVNGERKGVMVRPGMAVDSEDDSHGEPVARLDGPLRWAVEIDAAMVGDHRRPVAAARLGRREKEDCLFTAELCPHRQRASRAKPLYFAGRRPPCSARSAQLPNPCTQVPRYSC